MVIVRVFILYGMTKLIINIVIFYANRLCRAYETYVIFYIMCMLIKLIRNETDEKLLKHNFRIAQNIIFLFWNNFYQKNMSLLP